MLRDLPRTYLRQEGRVLAAIRDSDGPALVEAMRELGYLPGLSAEWDAGVLVEGMREAGWWFLDAAAAPARPRGPVARDGVASRRLRRPTPTSSCAG